MSRHASALAPEWFGDADALATEALREELRTDPDLLSKMQAYCPRQFEALLEATAEEIYVSMGDEE